MGSIPNSNNRELDMSIALTACDLPSIGQHAKKISGLAGPAAAGDDAARLSMLEAARSLVHALETPRETMIKHCWAQVSYAPAMKYI